MPDPTGGIGAAAAATLWTRVKNGFAGATKKIIETITQRLDKLEKSLDKLDDKYDKQTELVRKLYGDIRAMKEILESFKESQTRLATTMQELNKKFDAVEQKLGEQLTKELSPIREDIRSINQTLANRPADLRN